ncbi:MAG: hypothetical protein ACLQQ4_04695 [Bacteroidia bacterium]
MNNSKAKSRRGLANQFGLQISFICPRCNCNTVHHPNEIFAESENVMALPGAGAGGVIGILAGPLGVIVGGLIGAAATRIGEETAVNNFNKYLI